MSEDLLGTYSLIETPFLRQLAMDSFAALPPGHAMTAFMKLDVTEPLAVIAARRADGERVSLFAHVLACVGRALAAHPELNVVRHRDGRIARFDDVDISVPVEVRTADGPYPLQLVVRRAQDKDASVIYQEIADAKRRYASEGTLGEEDRWARRMMRLARWTPRAVRLALIRRMMADAKLVKRRAGTTLVTSVGKFASIPGFVAPLDSGPRAVTFAVGSVVEEPVVRDGAIVARSCLALTSVFNHDLVDGAPAARFAARLCELIESPEALARGACLGGAR
ncbi:MAG: 2-oxo acid dehydrogenase subunit E2 [Sandaracinaceae bacterium]